MLDFDEYELDAAELEAPKPYTEEQQSYLDELYNDIAADLAEINGDCDKSERCETS